MYSIMMIMNFMRLNSALFNQMMSHEIIYHIQKRSDFSSMHLIEMRFLSCMLEIFVCKNFVLRQECIIVNAMSIHNVKSLLMKSFKLFM